MHPLNISLFQKINYLKNLSEDDFRDKAIRPLFLRMGYTDGRDLCGPYEHGKDTVFGEKDRLGFELLIAVQTKKGNLNLASKTNSNLVEAITQLRTALETSITLVKNKSKVVPNRAILCASGKINDHARDHIIGHVSNPNIQFLDAHDLIPLIDENIPEFWLGIESDLLPYLRALQKEIIGDSFEDVAHDGVLSGAADDKVFVGLRLHRNIKKTKKFRGDIHEYTDVEDISLPSIINKKINKVLILGEGGSGKSTGLKRIALELARSAESTISDCMIPILIKAVELQRARVENLIEFCDNHTKSICNSNKSTFTIDTLSKGNLVVLLDALDEIPKENRPSVLYLLNEFSRQYPKCKIIVTSRPYPFTQELAELNSYVNFKISPISWKQTEKIFNSITKKRNISLTHSRELLRQLEKIHGIELNPLLVTVFAASTDFSKHDIPANITELFKKFTELMLGRWDEKKGLKHQYQAPLKDFVITKIAFHLHVRKEITISRQLAEDIAKSELIKIGREAEVCDLLKEIFDRSGLFRILGNDVEFKHHLLQEFFAGRAIDQKEFIFKFLSDEWWKRALVFYFGENPGSIELLDSYTKDLQTETISLQLEAITTIGLALQACYLSPVDRKLNVWKWVVSSLANLENNEISFPHASNTPMIDFLLYYFYVRDSVALSNIKQDWKPIMDWATKESPSDKEINERKSFWLIASLIEMGEIHEAENALKDANITNGHLLSAIHLGCFNTAHIRPVPENERKKAKELCAKLDKKVGPYIKQLLQEKGSLLLEMRKGKVEVIKEEEIIQNSEENS